MMACWPISRQPAAQGISAAPVAQLPLVAPVCWEDRDVSAVATGATEE